MKYLMISDIHANLEAFNKVIEHAQNKNWDKVISLGDETGYNANPNEVMKIITNFQVQGKLAAVLVGNHDKVAIGQSDASNFNERAKKSAYWTQSVLNPVYKKWLRKIPDSIIMENSLQFVHGSPVDPNIYISYREDALDAFDVMESRILICFFGHTHVPVIFQKNNITDEMLRHDLTKDEFSVKLDISKNKYIINPGSIGQPRDGINKASYMIFDSEKYIIEHYRVKYNIEKTQNKIIESGLPEINATRLMKGW